MTDTQAATAPGASPEPGTKMRREVLVVLPGLLLAIMLAMLDQLIVGTALPRIVGSLGGVAHLSWVVTAYVLASTITTPLYGKLGDMYGRKRLFMTAIVIFLAGSAAAGLSQSMAELITFRAIQGLGAGGLMVSAIAIIGDLVSPRERGQYMGYIMAVMMIATIGGPLLGGFITDSFSWRWIFYINLPIGGAALAYLAATLHLPRRRVEHRVDYLGALVLAVATTAIVLVSTWGGSQYAWASPQILGLCAVAVVAVALFIMIEARVAEPILPLHVFRNRNFSVVTGLSFLAGLAMFGAITFLPLYQQTVQGASPTVSGLLLTPMMVGVMITSLIAGQITTRTGRYKALPILGAAGMTIGMWLLSLLGVNTSRVTSSLYMVVLGLGMGFLMQMTTLIAQNSVAAPRHRRGQQLAAVLPADRRVDRGVGVRRHLRPAAGRRAHGRVTRRAHVHQRRPVRPGHGQVAARGHPARRVLRGLLRDPRGVPVGHPRGRAGLRPGLVHQGGAAARPHHPR